MKKTTKYNLLGVLVWIISLMVGLTNTMLEAPLCGLIVYLSFRMGEMYKEVKEISANEKKVKTSR